MIVKKLTRSENFSSQWPNIEDFMVKKPAFFDKHSYNFFRLDLTLEGGNFDRRGRGCTREKKNFLN